MLFLEVITIFFAAVAMSLALAHALEYPGKMRLDPQTYMAVQAIYYPGFTVGGVGEPLAALTSLILLILLRGSGAAFWWALAAFLALTAMHATFWLVTQPTNRFWLRNQPLTKAGSKFFGINPSGVMEAEPKVNPDWVRLRDRWEYSHIARAGFAVIALVALVVAVAN